MFGVAIEVVVGALVLGGLGLLVGLLLAVRSSNRRAAGRRHTAGATHGVRGTAAPAARAPAPAPVPEGPVPFAEPGARGPLFQYGGDGPGLPVDAPFAVVSLETTGLAPARGDRVVELAVVRVDARGRIEDEYATLVDPGRDVGPVLVHGISSTEVLEAPAFGDVAGELLARLDGAVVVLHNAALGERFLAAELGRIGVTLPLNPALCSLWLARRTLRAPDHRLPTLARISGLPAAEAHTALTDARTAAALLPHLLAGLGAPPRYLTGLRPMPELDRGAAPRPRMGEPPNGSDGWLAAMVAGLPRAVVDAPTAEAQRYVDVLALALADGRILGGEGQLLARLAGAAGIGADQVLALHRRVLEHLRAATLRNAIVTTAELRRLRSVASGLGVAGFFDDLRPTSPQDLMDARLR